MKGKIQILDEAVANKIAAGEVVERPSAVVKELLENAIDAGAGQINIEIEESGSKLIKVADNGCGMIKQDVVLALERHATSKIRSADDLFRIHTLGFRGEAMPSIAAVSLLEITTKTKDDLSGTYLKAIGGEIKEIKSAGCPDGTTVTVRDLFFNTPARLKYLRSGTTEMGHIIDLVNRISLAYPDLSLRLIHNGRQVLFSSGSGSLEEVIFNVFGKQMAENMLRVNTASEKIILTGYVGKPVNYKSNRSGMIFFVNGRYVKNRLISRAVEEAFKSYMLIRKYPVVILNFTIEPETIDVNVHPTKTEIRFSEEKELYTLTYQTVSQAIKRSSLIPKIEIAGVEREKSEIDLAEQKNNSFIISPKEVETVREERAEYQQISLGNLSLEIKKEIVQRHELPKVEIIGQIFNTYIVLEAVDRMYLLDQHAAHERILYEKFSQNKENKQKVQALLLPINLELTLKENELWQKAGQKIMEYGFIIEPFGEKSYLIRGIPQGMKEKNVLAVIHELLELNISDWAKNKCHKALAVMACHTAIKAGDILTKQEMAELLEQLKRVDNPYTCPHGRPTIIDFSQKDIEGYFKRR